MKLKNVLKYGVAAAALSMMLLCAPAAYAEGPEAEAAPADPAVAAESVEDENALFTGMHLSQSSMTLTVRSNNQNPSSSLSVRRTMRSIPACAGPAPTARWPRWTAMAP